MKACFEIKSINHLNSCLLRAAVTKQPRDVDFHNSFGLIQNEQVLNQWRSEECCSKCFGAVHYTILTDQRILLRDDECTIVSCLFGCCCDRSYNDKSIFLHKISEMDTSSISCQEKFCLYIHCRCPQDGILFHGAFDGSCCPIFHRKAYLTIDDRPVAQHAIATAIANAARRH
jgi:hypothetical protein